MCTLRCAIIQLYFNLVTKYSADDVIRNPSEPRVGLALDGLFFRAASPPADLLRQTQVKKTWCLVRLEGNWIESASTFSCDHPPADDCRFFRTVFFRRIQIRRSFLPSRTMNSFPGKKKLLNRHQQRLVEQFPLGYATCFLKIFFVDFAKRTTGAEWALRAMR